MEKARALVAHPRNTGKLFMSQDYYVVWYDEQRVDDAEILAVLLYTGTDVFSAYNADKRAFFNRQAHAQAVPRFPVLDRLLASAKYGLQTGLDEKR